MSDEWGPWIEHDGKGCPVRPGTLVRVLHAIGFVGEGVAGCTVLRDGDDTIPAADLWDWSTCTSLFSYRLRILRYQVRKPRGLTILENLIADLPQPVREDA